MHQFILLRTLLFVIEKVAKILSILKHAIHEKKVRATLGVSKWWRFVNYTIYVFGVQKELEVNSYPQSYASY